MVVGGPHVLGEDRGMQNFQKSENTEGVKRASAQEKHQTVQGCKEAG